MEWGIFGAMAYCLPLTGSNTDTVRAICPGRLAAPRLFALGLARQPILLTVRIGLYPGSQHNKKQLDDCGMSVTTVQYQAAIMPARQWARYYRIEIDWTVVTCI